MPQSHHISGPRTGCSGAVFNNNGTSTHGAHTSPVRRRTNFASPYGARRVFMHALQAYGPVRVLSLWTARAGTVSVRDFDQLWLCQISYVFERAPYGTLAGPAQALYGSRMIWKTLNFPVRGPYDARTDTARGTRGVLRIIQPNHKYADSSSRTGFVAWYDHGKSTDIKFLRALHLALLARNRTGDKNHTGPVVWCDWGIRDNRF